ncbi:MAG: M14 family metallopeptidase [Candidatus Aminicenantales bacterium]
MIRMLSIFPRLRKKVAAAGLLCLIFLVLGRGPVLVADGLSGIDKILGKTRIDAISAGGNAGGTEVDGLQTKGGGCGQKEGTGQGQAAVGGEDLAIVSVDKKQAVERGLGGLGLDFLFEWGGRVYILVGPGELARLDQASVPYLFENHKFPALSRPELSLQTKINGNYHSYKELETDLKALQTRYPQLARVFTLGKSLEGRNIYALKISDNVSLDEEETEVLFLGCHHAREWISVEVPYLLGKHLVEKYAEEAEVRRLVNSNEIWIVPLVNPDGLEYSIHYYRYWRKNRRLNVDGSYGVDLNRNYGYFWGYDDQGSSPEPGSAVYRGSAPFSEPETQAIRNFFLSKNIRALVSYHSYSQIILYPWGYTTTPTEQDSLLRQIAARMAELMKPVNGRVYQYGQAGPSLYLTNGDTTDWAFGVAGIPAYTIELPPIDQLGGGFFNPESEIQAIFLENLPAALYLLSNFDHFDRGRTTLNYLKLIRYMKFRDIF